MSSSSSALPIVIVVVPQSAAAHRVDGNHDYKDTDVDESQQPPFSLYVHQNCSLARVTLEANLFLLVAPRLAIRVGYCLTRFRHCPVCRVYELEPTVARRLAATRL